MENDKKKCIFICISGFLHGTVVCLQSPDFFSLRHHEMVVALPVPRIFILGGILGLFVFLGMFLDLIGMMLLALPIVFPPVVALGYDPIWFGVIVVKMGEICLITPPVGLNVYVVNSVAPDIPSQTIFRGIIPFLCMDFLTLAVLIAFPQIVTFLPSLMMKG